VRSVQFGWATPRLGDAKVAATWRVAAAAPPPLRGLLARQWLADRTALRANYLFDDTQGAAEAFLRDPAVDPEFARLIARADPVRALVPTLATLDAGVRLDRPIFIIAAPRSGSTLLFELLAQAPGVWTQGVEGCGAIDGVVALHPSARGYESDRLTEQDATPSVVACMRAGWRFGLRDRTGRPFDEPPGGPAARLLDKTTENCLRVPLLAAANPDARFVFLHRDARQSASSLVKAWEHGGFVRFDALPGWPRQRWCFLLPPQWRALRDRPLQDVATAQWDAANQCAMHDLEALPPSCWTSVDYHELVAHPRAVVKRLCAFLDLAADTAFDDLLARAPALSTTTISPPSTLKWRSHADLDVERIEAATRVTSARLRHLRAPREAVRPAPAAAAGRRRTTLVTQDMPTARYACRLSDIAPEAAEPPGEPLLVNPTLRLQLGTGVPLGMTTSTRFRERFVDDEPIAWTRSRATLAWQPWWVERAHAALLGRLVPGRPLPPCTPDMAARLHAAGIAETAREREADEAHAVAWVPSLTAEFAAAGYCTLRNALPAAATRALGAYYRALVASGGWAAGDAQVARRHGWHNEALARFFHHQWATLVGRIAEAPVCPSYCYVSAYQQGAELDPHVDRKQCEFTVSLIVDECGGRSLDWPLWFLAGSERRAVRLGVGDAVLFRGHDLPHWRETAQEAGLALSTLLFHYVPSGFGETLS
jgi:alkylated DNA repair dioxygenase AlkB